MIKRIIGLKEFFWRTVLIKLFVLLLIAKIASAQTVEWAKIINGYGGIGALELDDSSNIYIAGSMNNGAWFDTIPVSGIGWSTFFAKYYSFGNIQWVKRITHYWGGMCKDRFNNFYIGGYGPAYLTKFNLQGDTVWTFHATTISGVGVCNGTTYVFADNSGNIYMAGFAEPGSIFGTDTLTANDDSFLCKIDSSGNFLWIRTFQTYHTTCNGNYLLTGDTVGSIYISTRFRYNSKIGTDSIIGSTTDWDALVAKFDSSGNYKWVHTIQTNQDDDIYRIRIGLNQNLLMSGPVNSDYYITEISPNNITNWINYYGNSWYDYVNGMVYSNFDNSIFTTGDYNFDMNLNTHDYLTKYDSVGTPIFNKIFRDSLGRLKLGTILVDSNKAIYLGGFFDGTIYLDTIILQRPSLAAYPLFIKIDLSQQTGLIKINELHSFSLFPNPTTSTIHLTITTKQNTPLRCEIINVLGEKVFQKELQTLNFKLQTNLDVSFLAKGIYLVRVGDGKSFENKKLVIE